MHRFIKRILLKVQAIFKMTVCNYMVDGIKSAWLWTTLLYIKLIGPCNHMVYDCIIVMIVQEKECNANAAADNELNQFSFTISSKILDLYRTTQVLNYFKTNMNRVRNKIIIQLVDKIRVRNLHTCNQVFHLDSIYKYRQTETQTQVHCWICGCFDEFWSFVIFSSLFKFSIALFLFHLFGFHRKNTRERLGQHAHD